jgi:sulfatase modifying factor 1
MEAEWEYSCKAGTKTDYCSGDNEADADRVAWHLGNSLGTTHAVGQKQPNAFGLYDMHGNISQLCDNDFSAEDIGSLTPSPEPVHYSVRGGCWSTPAEGCRSVARSCDYSVGRNGFRILVPIP